MGKSKKECIRTYLMINQRLSIAFYLLALPGKLPLILVRFIYVPVGSAYFVTVVPSYTGHLRANCLISQYALRIFVL